MHPLLNIALRAARDSADALAHKTDRLDRINILEDSAERFVTSADADSDKTLIYHIQKAYPEHTIVSRVSGIHEGKEGEPAWLIDPLLGNRNFSRGYPRFAVSIAIRNRDVLEHAVVVAPMLSDEFLASRGNGAQWNSRRIRVTGKSTLPTSLIGVDYYGLDSQLVVDMQQALLRADANPRISGCGALDMLDVASGRLQGGWCKQQNALSSAAASLILQEAGGFLGSESGNPRLDKQGEMLFGEAELFKHLVKLRMRLRK